MNHVNIFFGIVAIFLVILFLSGAFFLINSPDFVKYLKYSGSASRAGDFLWNHIIGLHHYFIIFSLFVAFALYFAFVDLNWFKYRHFILAIIAVPLLICAGIYYFENYMFKELFHYKVSISARAANDAMINFVSYPKIYHLVFLIFIIIPGAVIVNNKGWYLKTILFLMVYLVGTVFIFRYFNTFILDGVDKINLFKGLQKFFKIHKLPEVKEIILSLLYLPIGIYLFNLADSIRGIKRRIDLGRIKKIQHG